MLLTEATEELEVVSEKTLDDIYFMLQEISADISILQDKVTGIDAAVENLQSAVLDKLDELLAVLQSIPQYEQIEYIIALLFMLVAFELMRLVKSWSNWHKGVK